MKPDVTVLMSVKNGGQLLSKSIESILSQTYRNFIFLIIDDGSTDQSWEIINSFQDNRILAKNFKENLGLTKRLEQGVSMIQTKYLARMDCDDICAKDRLKKQREFLETNSSYAAVGSNFIRKDATGKELFRSNFPLDSEDIKKKIFQKNPFKHASLFFETDKLKTAGSYNPSFKYAQDYELMLRLSAKYKTANLSEPLLTDFHTGSAVSQKHRFEQSLFAARAQIKALTLYGYSAQNALHLAQTIGYIFKSGLFSLANQFNH